MNVGSKASHWKEVDRRRYIADAVALYRRGRSLAKIAEALNTSSRVIREALTLSEECQMGRSRMVDKDNLHGALQLGMLVQRLGRRDLKLEDLAPAWALFVSDLTSGKCRSLPPALKKWALSGAVPQTTNPPFPLCGGLTR